MATLFTIPSLYCIRKLALVEKIEENQLEVTAERGSIESVSRVCVRTYSLKYIRFSEDA